VVGDYLSLEYMHFAISDLCIPRVFSENNTIAGGVILPTCDPPI